MEKIYVTRPYMPPKDDLFSYFSKIYENKILTNQGPLVCELEAELKRFLNVSYLHYVTNGTIALQLALKALDIDGGEIITTPFTYVATVSSILWERCTPVFCDIETDNFTIDPEKIEGLITPNTKAVMPVHVFGYACDVEKIQKIAEKHHLKVIYDAAHAFGSVYKGKALASYGDASTLSFHATKLFHHVSAEKNMRIEKQPRRQDNTAKEISGFTAAAFPPARQADSATPAPIMRETLFMPDGKPVMAAKQQNGKRHLKLKLGALAKFLQKSPLTPAVQRAFFRKATTGYPADGAKTAEMRKVYKTLLMPEFTAKKANRRTTARPAGQDVRTPAPAVGNNGIRRQVSARRSDMVGKRPSAFKTMTAKARLLWQRASRFGKNV